jgi:hypothetical protein
MTLRAENSLLVKRGAYLLLERRDSIRTQHPSFCGGSDGRMNTMFTFIPRHGPMT